MDYSAVTSTLPATRDVSPLRIGPRKRGLVLTAIALGIAAQLATRLWPPPTIPNKEKSLPLATVSSTEEAIRYYNARVRRDPLEARSQTALSELYLQRVRETGNEDSLPLALGAARATLKTVPALRNAGGLTALAHAEFANHSFAEARAHAQELIQLDPSKGESYAILGDAALELGDYEAATAAFAEMRRLQPDNPGTETRLARQSILRGTTKEAVSHFNQALTLLRALPQPPNETISWCQWQLGETAFSEGNYAAAEDYYREALETWPGSFRALGSLGRVRAARNDFPAAVSFYEQAARVAPAIEYLAALGDLYRLTGRERDAVIRYDLVAQLGDHSRKIHGTPYDRHTALFLADHDLEAERAYHLARAEFENGRHDIYGADALAWTALKAGHLEEAHRAMENALRLGTRDARLCYHAGMIERAAGDLKKARSHLEQAVALNPAFDPLQSEIGRQTLKELSR